MRRILMLAPDHTVAGGGNPGDGLILAGCERLVHEAAPDWTPIRFGYHDGPPGPVPECEALCVCGGPWFWDGFGQSLKFRGLMSIFSQRPSARRLFLGLGACLPLAHGWPMIDLLGRPAEMKAVREMLAGAQVVTCRDPQSMAVCQEVEDLEPAALVCPSAWAAPDPGRPLLILMDPRDGISGRHYRTNHADYERVLDCYRQFLYMFPDAVLACVWEPDRGLAPVLGRDPDAVAVWGTHEQLLAEVPGHPFMLSGRVHVAALGSAIGRLAACVVLDSRSQMWGTQQVWDDGEVRAVFSYPALRDQDHRTYISLIGKALAP